MACDVSRSCASRFTRRAFFEFSFVRVYFVVVTTARPPVRGLELRGSLENRTNGVFSSKNGRTASFHGKTNDWEVEADALRWSPQLQTSESQIFAVTKVPCLSDEGLS